ncbi:MAG: type 4b pilus protein PilO2 [Alphaproteobacteria bacterium]|nr:type 4b pilus protein PilO2 [Alphaproteobacteria bacterium]MBL0718043.1 type 4b pilus protein PilO2 [Alphaproteobacteria bacterium]
MNKILDEQIITINNRPFAVGMFWQPFEHNNVHSSAENISKMIAGEGDFYTARMSKPQQIGIGFKSKGHSNSISSATLHILPALIDNKSVLACFKVPQGFWILAIRNSLILPEEDFLYQNEEKAKKVFDDLLSLPDWKMKVAPQDWKIEGTQELSVNDIAGNTDDSKLKNIYTAKKTAMKVFITSIIFVLIFAVGFNWFGQYKEKKEVERIKQVEIERVEREKRLAEIRQSQIDKPKLVAPPQPYTEIYDRLQFAEFCEKWIALLYEPFAGWTVDSAKCSKNAVVVKTVRTNGTIKFLSDSVYKKFGKTVEVKVGKYGNKISLIRKMPSFITKLDEPPNRNKSQWIKELNLFFSALNTNVSMSDRNEVLTNPDQPSLKTNVSFIGVEIQSSIHPSEWGKVFKDLNSFEFISIVWNVNNFVWSYEGRAYVK